MNSIEKSLEAVVKLAVMTCACDGEVLSEENSLLQEWIDEKSEKYSPFLNRVSKNAMLQLASKGLQLKPVCDELSANAPVFLKYDAMELCMRIAQVDGVGADEEIRFLMSVGKWLDLDYEKFREMQNKILPSSIHESIDVDALLGLHAEMTLKEKRKHLMNEHKRWNQLATHSDSNKREQAKDMLEIIAVKRGELKDG